jgi:Holliday junction resolvasome RuvABC endonuclease subunit|tara:strand:+ start:306 stop:863 length:558 start_codon:yes stop_codon:yes gene_type:complete
MIKSIGIDYSLSCPAMCIETENAEDFHYLTDRKKYEGTFRPNITGTLHKGYLTSSQRYENIADWVITTINSYWSRHTVKRIYPTINLEDYSFASKGKTFHIAENMGLLKYKFWKADMPYQLIAPSSIKKFATGKGNANKELMVETFKQTTGVDLLTELDSGYNSPCSDIADSYFICKFQQESPLK